MGRSKITNKQLIWYRKLNEVCRIFRRIHNKECNSWFLIKYINFKKFLTRRIQNVFYKHLWKNIRESKWAYFRWILEDSKIKDILKLMINVFFSYKIGTIIVYLIAWSIIWYECKYAFLSGEFIWNMVTFTYKYWWIIRWNRLCDSFI